MTTRSAIGPRDGLQVVQVTGYAAPCRVCGEPAWLADDVGPIHPCCHWWVEIEGRSYCVACRAAKALREQRRSSSWMRRAA
jgi:hypothetical protein